MGDTVNIAAAAPSERIAIFVPSMAGGGAERAMLNLSRGLATRGYKVDMVLASAEGPYLEHIPASVRLVDLRATRVLASLPKLVMYLRRERPAAMIASMTYTGVVALWARHLSGVRLPLIVNEQTTLSPSVGATVVRNGRDRLLPLLARRFFPWSDGVAAVSQGVKDDLVHAVGLPQSLVHVVFNPVMTPELVCDAQASCDHPWLQPGEPPVLLAAGRLTVQKDFPTLLRAFALVRQSLNARLIIIGEGEDRPALESLMRELGVEEHVQLPGFVGNPFSYMAHAALFVLSSRWEGLPTVLIEAMCCGAPIVATDCPSGPREILADGRYGHLVPVGDAKALASAIGIALQGQRQPPPRESWRPYELDTIVDQYISLLLR